MNKVMLALLISISSIVLMGLITFLTIFFVQRAAFISLKKQVTKYNSLKTKVYSINFYRLNILAQNEMLNKAKFEQLKENYQTLKDNCYAIYLSLANLDEIVRKMNIKEAKRISKLISSYLIKTERELNTFIDQFNKNTQYNDNIEDALQISIDMFNKIKHYYHQNIIHNSSFVKINTLINETQKIINDNIDFTKTYDFDSTVKIFADLHAKIKALWKAITIIAKLQFVDVYLQTTKKNNEDILTKVKTPLSNKDVELLNKVNKIYDLEYDKFKKAYLSFDLNNAYKYAVNASKDIAIISKFTYLRSTSEQLIEQSINVINEQTANIINNKEQIVNSVKSLATYFAKDQKTSQHFIQLEKDIDSITQLKDQANNLKDTNTYDKINALKQLESISKSISLCKDSISTNVEKINDTLQSIINLLSKLYELHTYFIQMVPTIKVLAKDTELSRSFISLLKNNITLVNTCVNEIIKSDNPDYGEIANKIARMIEDTRKIKEKINSTIILKSYASKLMLYANRYRKESTIEYFEKAEEEYKSKNFTDCIDTLLAICKKCK